MVRVVRVRVRVRARARVSARNEFMQEMELMSNLRHPNIVRFLGACLELAP